MIRCAPPKRPAMSLVFALVLAGVFPFLPLQAPAEAAGTGLRLSGGTFAPYRFTHVRLECEAGIVGDVRVTGDDWNGKKRLLYEGQSKAWAGSIELVFYVDEGLKSLAIEAETGNGRQNLSLDLAALALSKAVPDAAELARRTFLRDLPLPYSSPRQLKSPVAMEMAASGLSDAASQIAASCLCLEPPTRVLAALAFFIVAAAGLAASKRRMRPGMALAATLGLSILALAAVIILLPREPRMIIVDLPRPQGEGAMAYRGRLALESGMVDGASVMRYSASSSAGLSFTAVSTPGKSGIPLSIIEARPGSLVFSSPPIVVAKGAGLELHCERWTTGWMSWPDE